MEHQYDYIVGQVESLKRRLDQGPDEKSISRLLHYGRRIASCTAKNQGAKDAQQDLSNRIRGMINRYGTKRVVGDKLGREKTVDERRDSLGQGNGESDETAVGGGEDGQTKDDHPGLAGAGVGNGAEKINQLDTSVKPPTSRQSDPDWRGARPKEPASGKSTKDW